MEEVPESEEERNDPAAKFYRILGESRCDAVAVYWPPGAKMAATWAELVLLVERQRQGQAVPPLHYIHHTRAMDLDGTRLRIRERGGRHLYLQGASRLAAMAWPWKTPAELRSAVAWCGARIAGLNEPLPAPAAVDLRLAA